MRGMGHTDAIETAIFRHEEGNEGEKIGVKRGIGAFYGRNLLKRQGRRWNEWEAKNKESGCPSKDTKGKGQ